MGGARESGKLPTGGYGFLRYAAWWRLTPLRAVASLRPSCWRRHRANKLTLARDGQTSVPPGNNTFDFRFTALSFSARKNCASGTGSNLLIRTGWTPGRAALRTTRTWLPENIRSTGGCGERLRHLERAGGQRAVRATAALLPDELVSRALRGHVSGHAVGGLPVPCPPTSEGVQAASGRDRHHPGIRLERSAGRLPRFHQSALAGVQRSSPWRRDWVGAGRRQFTPTTLPGSWTSGAPPWRVGKAMESEARVRRADGQYRWLLIRNVPLHDKRGKIVKWYGTSTDIDDRKRAEETLREQADLLSLTHDTIFVMDMEGVIKYWNRGAEERYGWTAEQAVGRVVHDLLKTVFPAPLEQIKAEVIRTGRWEGELLHTKKDGTQVWWRAVGLCSETSKARRLQSWRPTTTSPSASGRRRRCVVRIANCERSATATRSSCAPPTSRACSKKSAGSSARRPVTAWRGWAMPNTTRPKACALPRGPGPRRDISQTSALLGPTREHGRGPTGTAIRSGKSCCIQDFATDPRLAPWRESAVQRDFRSGIALPLKDEHANAFGSLTIYSEQPNAFTSEEIRLLEELAADLAFGIVTLRSRAARQAGRGNAARGRDALPHVCGPRGGRPLHLRLRARDDCGCEPAGLREPWLYAAGINWDHGGCLPPGVGSSSDGITRGAGGGR